MSESKSKPQWYGANWWIPESPHKTEVYESEAVPEHLRIVAEIVGPLGMEREVALLLREAPNLYAELEDAACDYEETANTLDAWAQQSLEGGWSTYQVKANRETADTLRRKAAGYRLVLAKARGVVTEEAIEG